MTVTELRQALEKLEAEGQGQRLCVILRQIKDSEWWDDPELRLESITAPAAEPGYPEGAEILRF